MIYDLLELYQQNSEGDTLVLDNYQLKEGLYFKIYGPGREPEVIKLDKKQVCVQHLRNFFVMADFYSQLVEMNKPVDPKKQIHSNNLYAVTCKAGTLTEGTGGKQRFIDSVIRYYKTIANPKKEDADILKNYNLPPLDESILTQNRDYIIQLVDFIQEKIVNYDLKPNLYVKLFFAADTTDYIRESQRYLIPKIFNKNEFNINLSNELYGLSNSNMGMNEKKPFLEHKTTAFRVPFRIRAEQALTVRNMFIWLDGQIDEDGKSKTAGYLPICNSSVFGLNDRITDQINAHFLHLEKGIHPVIDDYDFLPGITDKMAPPLLLENFLHLENFDRKPIHSKIELEGILDDLLFNSQLVKNYFQEKVKPNDWLSAFQVDILVRYKNVFLNFFRKGEDQGFIRCIEWVSKYMLLDMLYWESSKRLEDSRIAKGLNLRLSLLQYFNVGGYKKMGDRLQALSEGLKAKLVLDKTDNNIYCESDTEFFYYSGQLVRYLVSKSQAQSPNYYIIKPLLTAQEPEKFKKEIYSLHNKYSYDINIASPRYNKLLAAVMGYEYLHETIEKFDAFLAGFASKNMIYFKEGGQ